MSVAHDIPVQIFREIMVLPLALEKREDAENINKWLDASQDASSAWEEVIPANGAPDGLLRHVPKSKVYKPFSLRPAENENDPAKVVTANESPGGYDRRWAYAEAAYFHPFVQRFLYGDGRQGDAACDRPLRLFRRKCGHEVAKLHVVQGYRSPVAFGDHAVIANSFAIDLTVERLNLYVMPDPGLAILVVEVGASRATNIEPCQNGTPYFPPGCPTPITRDLTLVEVLALHDGLRRVYPPFLKSLGSEQSAPIYDIAYFPARVVPRDNENKPLGGSESNFDFDGTSITAAVSRLVDKGALPMAPWWQYLLDPLAFADKRGADAVPRSGDRRPRFRVAFRNEAEIDEPVWHQVIDDRMPTMVFVAVEDTSWVDRSDRIRLAFADGWEPGLPYAESFLEDFEDKHCYRRFEHYGTLYMTTSYSFVTLVGTDERELPKSLSFPLDVLQEHFRRHYYQMFFITHMQRAALLMFSNWMSQAIDQHRDFQASGFRNALQAVRHAVLRFTHRYWFSNVSNQEQAREMFALMQEQAGNIEYYREVMAESAAAKQELEAIAGERLQHATTFLNVFFALAAIIGVPVGVLQGLGAVVGGFKVQPAFYFACLAALFVFAGCVIALITSFQTEGRISRTALRALLRPWRAGSNTAMRWLVLVALGVLVASALLFFCLAVKPGHRLQWFGPTESHLDPAQPCATPPAAPRPCAGH